MTVELRLEKQITASPERVFALSLLADLHVESMRGHRERAIRGVSSGALVLGDEVTWRAWHFGVPWTMTSRITAVDAPKRFVDEQVRGPFRSFHHEHLFDPDAQGTRMTDIVVFRAPLGFLGRLVERYVLARYMQALIETRNAFIQQAAEKPDPT